MRFPPLLLEPNVHHFSREAAGRGEENFVFFSFVSPEALSFAIKLRMTLIAASPVVSTSVLE